MKKSFLVLLVSAGLSFFPAIASAEISVPHLEASGVGEVEAIPDMADINVAVSLLRKTAKEAKNASDEAISSLLQRLDKMGIARKDIKSANISLYAEYSYPKDSESKLRGYRASRNVTITVRDLNKLNSVLDGALADGLNKISGINLRTSQEDKLKARARNKAIEDAINKANALARGFNQKISGVWKISYDNYSARPYMKSMSAERAGNSMGYVDSRISIRDSVNVIFTINGNKVEYVPIN